MSTYKYKILIVDGTNHLNRYFHILNPLYNSELQDVSIIRAFMLFLSEIVRYEGINELHVIFDVGRDLKKKKLYEKYKANRVRVSNLNEATGIGENDIHKIRFSREALIKILSTLPNTRVYPILSVEGDTVLAYVYKKLYERLKNKNDIEFIILSNDKDFYQLLSKNGNTKILRYYSKKGIYEYIDFKKAIEDSGYVSARNIEKYFNVVNTLSDNFPYYRAVIGDRSDNIIGIKGIGSGFIRWLTDKQIVEQKSGFKNLEDFKNFIMLLKEKYKSDKRYLNQLTDILENFGIVELNLKLLDFNLATREIDNHSRLLINDILENDSNQKDDMTYYSELIEKYELNSDESDYINLITLYILLKSDNKMSFNGVSEHLSKWKYVQELLLKMNKSRD